MNGIATNASARIGGIVLVLVLAATAGLVIGNAINSRADGGATNLGYPAGYSGGAAVPVSHTAQAVFSADALAALHVARGDIAQFPARAEESDHGLRHAQAAEDSTGTSNDAQLHPQFRDDPAQQSAPAESDYHDRHR